MEAGMIILTAMLVLITGVYAYLTNRLAKTAEQSAELMREQNDSISRPYVCLSLFKPKNDPFIFLRVENTGKTSAHNMTLRFGAEFQKVRHLKLLGMLENSYLFTKTLGSFPPNSPIMYIFGCGASLPDSDASTPQDPISVTATYSFGKQTVTETTWLDVNQYNSTTLDKDPVVDALNKIREEIAKK